jgi:hypothetical protein
MAHSSAPTTIGRPAADASRAPWAYPSSIASTAVSSGIELSSSGAIRTSA